MDYEELRPLVLEVLKQNAQTQVIAVIDLTESFALQKGFYKDAPTWFYGGFSTEHKMPKEDREKVREIINDLVTEGILGWGIDEHNPAPSFLKVTAYGTTVLQAEDPQPLGRQYGIGVRACWHASGLT